MNVKDLKERMSELLPKEQIDIMEERGLVGVQIELCLQYSANLMGNVFIPLKSGKVVEIGHDTEDFTSNLERYISKGLKRIYMKENDYLHFLALLRESVAKSTLDNSQLEKESVEVLEEGYKLLKSSLLNMGVSKAALNLAKEISKGSITTLKNSPNLYSSFKNFKENCPDEFIENMYVSYMVSVIIGSCEWQTKAIKEKANIGVLLSDITMEPEDFIQLKRWVNDSEDHNLDFLERKIKEHPLDAVNLLKEDGLISSESLMMIEQHHERPNETAFPHKLGHKQITLLSAIHICVRHFVELVIFHEFDPESKEAILIELEEEYTHGNFKNAFAALKKCLGD